MIDLDALQSGLQNGEFFLEYLPTVAVRSGCCRGAEALSRWRRSRAIVPPLQFIPLLEGTPLEEPFTRWVLETIARELGGWLRNHGDVHVSLNVAPAVLGGIRESIRRAGLDDVAERLVLEVSERALAVRGGTEALNAAAAQGFRLALDDVHAAAANPGLLERYAVNTIKIDRAVLAHVGRAEMPTDWLGGLRALLQTGRVEVVAEGVETAEQVEVIRGLGVTLAQGFYYAPPLAAAAFAGYFAQRG